MGKGKGKKKAKGTSNVFSMFEQSQIQEFKEAFGMIDANRDGFIDKEDLRSTYASLGVMSIENSKLDEMMAEAPASINFTVFLNMLADKLHGTDSEDVILNAFKLFDPEGKGKTRFFFYVLSPIFFSVSLGHNSRTGKAFHTV